MEPKENRWGLLGKRAAACALDLLLTHLVLTFTTALLLIEVPMPVNSIDQFGIMGILFLIFLFTPHLGMGTVYACLVTDTMDPAAFCMGLFPVVLILQ